MVQAGEVEAVRDAHVAWVAAELAARPFKDATTLYPLLPEAANIRAGMDWLLACGRDRELIALFVSSAGIWYLLLEPELDAKMASAFARCSASLTRCEQAEALTIMSAVASDRGPWV